MKVEEFNTLKLIHDNIPNATFVIVSFLGYYYPLRYERIIYDKDKLTVDEVSDIMECFEDPLYEDDVRFLTYSEMVEVDDIADFVFSKYDTDIYHYDYLVIDMRK